MNLIVFFYFPSRHYLICIGKSGFFAFCCFSFFSISLLFHPTEKSPRSHAEAATGLLGKEGMNWTNSGLTYGLRLVGLHPPEKTHARPEQGWNGTPSSLEKTTRESGRGGLLSFPRPPSFPQCPAEGVEWYHSFCRHSPLSPPSEEEASTVFALFSLSGEGGRGQARLDQNLRNLRRLVRRKEVSGKLVRNNVSLSGRPLPRFF